MASTYTSLQYTVKHVGTKTLIDPKTTQDIKRLGKEFRWETGIDAKS